MRTPFIAANWKMYKTVQEAVVFVKELSGLVKDFSDVRVVVAPPFTAVASAAWAARNTKVAVAAQDVYWEREGAFTGEVSGAMIKEAGADYVIVGHSERRRLFNDTDEAVNRKARAAIQYGLTPIVCVGETLQEREQNQTLAVLDRQVKNGFAGFTAAEIGNLVVAYEPVWAIGTGKTATSDQAEEAHAHIRARLAAWFSAEAAERCHIIYGGSVKPDNTAEL